MEGGREEGGLLWEEKGQGRGRAGNGGEGVGGWLKEV